MKNKKIFTVLFLLAATALLFSSCAFKMNTAQKAHYELFIKALEKDAERNPMDAQVVVEALAAVNTDAIAKNLNYQVIDKKPGTDIAKGTKAAELRKRFVPKKIK